MSSFEEIDEEDLVYAITENLCNEFSLYYNEAAAEEAAISQEEMYSILKDRNLSSEEELEKAIIEEMLEEYKLCLELFMN
jgi:hypothetical protein